MRDSESPNDSVCAEGTNDGYVKRISGGRSFARKEVVAQARAVAALATTSCRNCGLPLHHHASCAHTLTTHLPLLLGHSLLSLFASPWRWISRALTTNELEEANSNRHRHTKDPAAGCIRRAIDERMPHLWKQTRTDRQLKTKVPRDQTAEGNIYVVILCIFIIRH